jgi:non-ribosomal peptide synthetase component F
VEELGLPRELSRSPLFDVMVSMQNAYQPPLTDRVGDLTLSEVSLARSVSKFDLLFLFNELAENVTLDLVYDTELFAEERMHAVFEHLERLLHGLVREDTTPIGQVNYLPAREAQQLLGAPFTEVAYPGDKTVMDLFRAQAADRPDAVALVFLNRSYTYRELDETSDQLARYLVGRRHVQPGDVVGILLPRSEWVVIAILAVLKAGAAYLPLDPDYPDDRLRFMVQDADPKLLIVENQEAYRRVAEARREGLVLETYRRLPDARHGTVARPGGRAGLHHLHLRFHGNAQRRAGGAQEPDPVVQQRGLPV